MTKYIDDKAAARSRRATRCYYKTNFVGYNQQKRWTIKVRRDTALPFLLTPKMGDSKLLPVLSNRSYRSLRLGPDAEESTTVSQLLTLLQDLCLQCAFTFTSPFHLFRINSLAASAGLSLGPVGDGNKFEWRPRIL